MQRRKLEKRKGQTGHVCSRPGLAPLPACVLGALRGGAVDGRSMCQGGPGGASSVHGLASRLWVVGVREGGEGP